VAKDRDTSCQKQADQDAANRLGNCAWRDQPGPMNPWRVLQFVTAPVAKEWVTSTNTPVQLDPRRTHQLFAAEIAVSLNRV